MERTRKEYLVLKSDQAGEADIVGVFSSKKKARSAVEKDSVRMNRNYAYWLVILAEDRIVDELSGKNKPFYTKAPPSKTS